MQRTVQETQSINDIINQIDNGKWVLPEFQRDFKWPIEKSITLFDSIFRDLFIGSLIISKPKFELVCRGFDLRPKGSKARKPEKNLYTKEKFDNEGIYTLLDGQQRVTSIYRAFKGHDNIYVIFRDINVLLNSNLYNAEENDVFAKFEDYIEAFGDSKPNSNRTFYLKISDLYNYTAKSESKFIKEIINITLNQLDFDDKEKQVFVDYGIKLFSDFKSDILKKDLLSVQLLDMDLENFCLYFERSNSQGLNLSFTDIITAKIYLKFKLGEAIEKALEDHKGYFKENLVDPLVRYINYKDNKEVTKSSILKDLKGESFINHWDKTVKDLVYIQKWLEEQNWVFKVEKIPYKTMLLPLLSFYQNLSHEKFAKVTPYQLDVLRFWFYASIFDNRYGGARHGSTNVVLKKDCETLGKLAKEEKIEKEYWDNFRIDYSQEEFIRIDSAMNTKFMTINYMMWLMNTFKNFENSNIISVNADIEVHHFFPSNYIKTKFGKQSEEYDKSDSVLNKVRINKIPNITIGDKSPSTYLKDILKVRVGNVKGLAEEQIKEKVEIEKQGLIKSLESHGIPNIPDLINGKVDDQFESFLSQRYLILTRYLDQLNKAHQNIKADLTEIW